MSLSEIKRKPTTISRKKYEALEYRLENATIRIDDLTAKLAAMQKGRDEAAQMRDALAQEIEKHKQRANDADIRASRAEGYASALLDKQYAPRPELPWEKPMRVDQWGNPQW